MWNDHEDESAGQGDMWSDVLFAILVVWIAAAGAMFLVALKGGL